MLRIAHVIAAATIAALIGPPKLVVKPTPNATVTMGAPAFDLDVDHHVQPEELTVSAFATGVRAGQRVTVPLTVRRLSASRFSVARQWETGQPWVLVFSAKQGPNGKHGTVEAVVRVDARGAVQRIDYVEPGFPEAGANALAATRKLIEGAVKEMSQVVGSAKPS